MYIRKTEEKDVRKAAEIYAEARSFMRDNGNCDQWSTSYPSAETVRADMRDGTSYVCVDGDEVVGVFYFNVGADPTYEVIYDGEWLSDAPYSVIHRIAVKYHGRGIVGFCFDEMFKIARNIRIDTHRDNIPMQRALEKRGFQYCGIIHLENGDERLAYQRVD